MSYFKAINLVIGIILGYISPKTVPKDCCYLWCSYKTQVLLSSFRWNKFLVSLFLSIQFFFPWVAGCHLIIWVVFHKTISSLFFSLLVSNNSVRPFSYRCIFKLFCGRSWHFSSLFFYFNYLSSILLFRSHCDVTLFSHHLGSCSFRDYPFNRSVLPLCSSSFISSSLHLFSTEVLPKSVLSYSSFLTECFQLCSSPLFYFFQFVQPFQGSLVSLVCQWSNLVLPLLFLFRCPSGAILDLGTRSSRSGGVL